MNGSCSRLSKKEHLSKNAFAFSLCLEPYKILDADLCSIYMKFVTYGPPSPIVQQDATSHPASELRESMHWFNFLVYLLIYFSMPCLEGLCHRQVIHPPSGRDLPCVCLMCYSYSCRAVLVSFIQACICLPQTPTTPEIACCGVSHEISPGMFIECWTMFYRVILTPTM